MDVAFGPYRLKRHERAVLGQDGPVELSARSFDILSALLEKPGEVLSKDALFTAVWPGVAVEENTLQVHISALRKALDPSFIVTVHGRGYKYAGPAPAVSGGEAIAVKADAKPVIAVLPFDNLSGDPAQQYFSDGITDDIIDRLARYRDISVIGANSSAALRGKDDDLGAIRERLAADYVVTGNVRRSAGRIRIAVRLTDIGTGTVVWADRYDRPTEDIFTVQDEVAAVIASSLQGHVEVNMAYRPNGGGRDISSYEQVLRGIARFKELTVAGNMAAAQYFERAIAINAANAEAYRWLSSCRINDWFIHHRRESLQDAITLARRAVALDPASARCLTALGYPQIWAEGIEAAAQTYAAAYARNAGDPHVLAELGLLQTYRGDLIAAHDYLSRAEALNPVPPLWYAEFRAIAAFAEGRYADALPAFAAIPECVFDAAYVAACLAYADDRSGLTQVMNRVRESDWDLLAVAMDEPYRDPEPRERLIEGVRRAMDGSAG